MANTVLVGAQWGDEGKGKVIDVLTAEADLVVRYQGGSNAGHTVIVGGRKHVLHLVPSGILHPGKDCAIGNGVVVDPLSLLDEIHELERAGIVVQGRLFVSDRAHLVLRYHNALDRAEEAARGVGGRLGTTGRGIGPAYRDKICRCGLRMGDLLEPDFAERLAANVAHANGALKVLGAAPVDGAELQRLYAGAARELAPYIADTVVLINAADRAGRSILLEGAQATMLDVDFGTYPYVTSSHTIAGGVCVGTGIGPHAIDRILGVSKAYATRVGEGPFTTELHDATGETLRHIGGEYGATTKRPRRCGWLDIVQLRRAARLNSLDGLILTKLDVLDGFEQIGVCTAYRCGGKRRTEWPANPVDLATAEPIYTFLPGWKQATTGATSFQELPAASRAYINQIERWLDLPVVMISNGQDRKQLITRRKAF